jgi:DNA polymerase III delta subunit
VFSIFGRETLFVLSNGQKSTYAQHRFAKMVAAVLNLTLVILLIFCAKEERTQAIIKWLEKQHVK